MNLGNEQDRTSRPQPVVPHPMHPSRCVILVPFATYIAPACERGLIELQRRGYEVWRVGGYAAIDQGRNQLATDALAAGFEETFWIDADIDFHPDDVDRLRSYGLPITSGIYARKGAGPWAARPCPARPSWAWATAAACANPVRRGGLPARPPRGLSAIQERLALPMCNERFGRPMVPFFQPMVHNTEGGPWYLAEDWGTNAGTNGVRLVLCTIACEGGQLVLGSERGRVKKGT